MAKDPWAILSLVIHTTLKPGTMQSHGRPSAVLCVNHSTAFQNLLPCGQSAKHADTSHEHTKHWAFIALPIRLPDGNHNAVYSITHLHYTSGNCMLFTSRHYIVRPCQDIVKGTSQPSFTATAAIFISPPQRSTFHILSSGFKYPISSPTPPFHFQYSFSHFEILQA